MITSKDFFLALEDLEREKGISQDVFIDALQSALAFAYKKQSGDAGNIVVRLNPEKTTIKVYAIKTVVDEVVDPDSEMSIEEAREYKKTVKVGEVFSKEIAPKDFGRIAAQTAKQVIMQKLREAEHDNTVTEFQDKEDQIINCIVRREEAQNIYVEIGKGQIEGVLMLQDQVPGEKYTLNEKLIVYVKKVRNNGRNAQIVVSRSAAGLVKRLFENEVPEIAQGIVQIKGIAREPGQRTKIAIYSTDPNVDAVGACVGRQGLRVNPIVSELNGEKIDIIQWSEDPLEFIAKSLSPAKVIRVYALEGEKAATVVVPDDKLSLAIGREGQNVRLAARLTGWKIDVKSESRILAEFEDMPSENENEDTNSSENVEEMPDNN